MDDSTNDFQPVSSEQDRVRILKNFAVVKPQCAGILHGHTPFLCSVVEETGDAVVIDIADLQCLGAKNGESCMLMFALSDGQYVVSGTIRVLSPTRVSIPVSSEVKRLQRRNNFRVPVPSSFRGHLTVFDGPLKQDLPLLDLSVGGVRVRWANGTVKPTPGKIYPAELVLPDRKLPVTVSIRVVFADGHANVGMQFASLSGADEQGILFLCLQLQRNQTRII